MGIAWKISDKLRSEKSCKDVACVVLVPSVLLSLVLIGVCTLFIYLHLPQARSYKENFFQIFQWENPIYVCIIAWRHWAHQMEIFAQEIKPVMYSAILI